MSPEDEDYYREFEYHMEQAADMCRGRRMTEEEWNKYRQLWAGVGMVLSPCKPDGVDSNEELSDDDAYDRAMDFLK